MHVLVPEPDGAVLDHAFFGVENAGHRLQKRRFSRAVGSEQRDDAALGNGYADVADGLDGVVVDDTDIAKFKQASRFGRDLAASGFRLRRDRHKPNVPLDSNSAGVRSELPSSKDR